MLVPTFDPHSSQLALAFDEMKPRAFLSSLYSMCHEFDRLNAEIESVCHQK